MGEVFLCKQAGIEGIEHYGVVKAVRGDQAESAEAVRRFLDEAAVLVHLSHKNICQVSKIGRAADNFYVAMELIAGRHLGEVLTALKKRAAPMPEKLALFVLGEVLAALDYAHRLQHPVTGEALGIVHRDVSPQNVMVSFEGEVKLIDFGLARSSLKREQTARGVRVGKIAYMSPEQMRSEPLDERTDQYAAAVLGYELLTNRRFYSGLSGDALFQAVGQGGYVPAAWDDLDFDVRSVLAKALHPDPKWRYESCGLLRRDLASVTKRRTLFADGEDLRALMGELFPDGPAEQRALLQRFATLRAPGPKPQGDDFEDISSAGHVVPETFVGHAPTEAGATELDKGATSTEVLLSNPHATFIAEGAPGSTTDEELRSTTGRAAPSPRSVSGLTLPQGEPVSSEPGAALPAAVSIPDRSSVSSSPPSSSVGEWDVERTEIVGRQLPPDRPGATVRVRRDDVTPPERGRGPPKVILAAAGATIVVLLVAIPVLLLTGDGPFAHAAIGRSSAGADEPPTADVAAPRDAAAAAGAPVQAAVPDDAPDDRPAATPGPEKGLHKPAAKLDEKREKQAAENEEKPPEKTAERGDQGRAKRPPADRGRRGAAPRKTRPPPPMTDPVTFSDKVKVLEWCRGKESCAATLLKKAPRLPEMPVPEQRAWRSDLDRCARACLR